MNEKIKSIIGELPERKQYCCLDINESEDVLKYLKSDDYDDTLFYVGPTDDDATLVASSFDLLSALSKVKGKFILCTTLNRLLNIIIAQQSWYFRLFELNGEIGIVVMNYINKEENNASKNSL